MAPSVVVPIISLALGTWQVYRLDWKMKLLATLEDRLVRNPLPLPPRIDPSVLHDFDYRRVRATGHFRHDQEMLLGPRMREGKNGYWVVTPLERDDGASKILVNRGWVAKTLQDHADRKEGLPAGRVTVEGLLREPWKKNFYTLENNLDKWEFYFPDVEQMARITESEPIWVEATAGASCNPASCQHGLTDPWCRTGSHHGIQQRGKGHTNWTTRRGHHSQQPRPVHLHMVRGRLAGLAGRCSQPVMLSRSRPWVLTGPQVWIIDCDLRNVLDALTKAYRPKSKDGQLEPKVVAEHE